MAAGSWLTLSILVVTGILLVVPGARTGLRWAARGGIQIALGALFLFLLNTVGGLFQFHLPINLFTSAVVGLLGLPGLGALFVIQWMVAG